MFSCHDQTRQQTAVQTELRFFFCTGIFSNIYSTQTFIFYSTRPKRKKKKTSLMRRWWKMSVVTLGKLRQTVTTHQMWTCHLKTCHTSATCLFLALVNHFLFADLRRVCDADVIIGVFCMFVFAAKKDEREEQVINIWPNMKVQKLTRVIGRLPWSK